MEIVERNCLIFNGIDLRNYGLYVSGDKTFGSPQKEITKVSIPGRSGDLIRFGGRYQNVILEYSSILIEDFDNNAAALRSILMTPTDYVRLEDGYHPNEYRMAFFTGPLDFDSVFLEAGSTILQFDCKPQRWLKSGEVQTEDLRSLQTITNPTAYPAKPLIVVATSSNSVRVDFTFDTIGITMKLETVTLGQSSTFYIDCESMDCYQRITGGSRMDSNSALTVMDFPYLVPGENSIIVSGSGFDSVYMIPRWYIL